jgi:hypothetical protein
MADELVAGIAENPITGTGFVNEDDAARAGVKVNHAQFPVQVVPAAEFAVHPHLRVK